MATTCKGLNRYQMQSWGIYAHLPLQIEFAKGKPLYITTNTDRDNSGRMNRIHNSFSAMAKGKIPLNAEAVEKHAKRINQLSLMIADYSKTDTSGFKVKTEALNDIWKKPEAYAKRINDLTKSSATLQAVAMSGDTAAIKRAIGGVGKTCGGCHDNFRAD